METYSIATFNIHNFRNAGQQITLREIIDTIQKYDIVALQEVSDNDKLNEIIKGWNYIYNRSTLLLSKYPIKENVTDKNIKERHTAALIQLPSKRVFVSNIHLNYRDENIRITEMDNIMKLINPYVQSYPSILLGDFNALTSNDYDNSEWANIYNIREKGNWELPVHILTDSLNILWEDSGKDNYSQTCRYNTRIDYIYTKEINKINYEVVKTMPHISDHNLVTISFE
jgi:endonuclease/exonuclease/phosphatase family metal-dependent hydrolase